MSETRSFIESNFERLVSELQAWCRQPSVSTINQGMAEMAALVQARFAALGFSVQITHFADGFPVICAERAGRSKRCLLFYNHYDVQPADPLEDWYSDAFSAEIREGRLHGRGVADNKGCLLARIHAVEALLQTCGELPVGVKFMVEGEEEIGSPHLESFVNQHRDLLAADWCVWEYAAKNELGNPTATFGNKGICYVQLTATGPRHDWHSMFAPVVPNPAWRLAWALSSLKNAREEILVPGFYDDVEPISEEEQQALARIPVDEDRLKAEVGLEHLLLDVTGDELKRRLYGAPTCTICGLISGYTGPGSKTIVPARATAKIDFRLVQRQRPEDIVVKLSQHLLRLGFGDVEVELLHGVSPSKTPVSDPFAKAIARAACKAYTRELVILPSSPGTGPRHVFSTWTDMPIVGLGVGNVGSAVHGPNENVILEDYFEGTVHMAELLAQLGSCQ